jgi:Matrixin
VAWPKKCVSYALARAASKEVPLAEATRVAAAAFNAWQSVTCPGASEPPSIVATEALGPTDCAESSFDPDGANANVILFRDESWPYRDLADAVAFTATHFDENGDVLDSDIEINSTLPISTADVVPKKSYDLLSILTHEAGHFLGLAHSYEPGAIMQPSIRPGTTDDRVLGADDIAAICGVYPPGRDAMPCDFTPRGGFAAACPSVEAKGGCTTAAPGLSSGSAAATHVAVILSLVCRVRLRARR